jgi:hypothetical protein
MAGGQSPTYDFYFETYVDGPSVPELCTSVLLAMVVVARRKLRLP